MKTKATLIAVLLSTTGVIWASDGGLSVDSADKDTMDIALNQTKVTEIGSQDTSNRFNPPIDADYTVDSNYNFESDYNFDTDYTFGTSS